MINSNRNNKFSIVSITWPLFIQSFLGLLMGNINVFMISHYSDKAVGAIGVSNQIIGMLGVLYNVVSMGTAIIITQYIGAKDFKMSKRVSEVSVLLNVVLGLIFSFVLIVFSKELMIVMNIPREMMQYGIVYIKIVGGSSCIQAVILTFSAILRGHGYSKLPMKIAIMMNIINIIGNYISIFKPLGLPAYGIFGVAISVLISNIAGLIVIFNIARRQLNLNISIRNLYPLPVDVIKKIMMVGGPAAGEYISYSFSQIMITYFVTSMGINAINVRIYAQNLVSFVYVLGLSIGQGTQIVIGYLRGEGKIEKVLKTGLTSLKIAVCSNLTMSVIFYIFSRKLLGIFTNNSTMIDLGRLILLIDVFLEVGRAFNHVIMASLRGTGDVKYPVVISIISMWGIAVLLSYTLGIGLKFGLVGIWIASACDEWFRGLVLLKRWVSRRWEKLSIITDIKA